jgi:hypothetical protein
MLYTDLYWHLLSVKFSQKIYELLNQINIRGKEIAEIGRAHV